MRYSVSLNKNADFQRAYRKGRSAAAKTIAVYFRKNGGRGLRLGITVSTKLGKAVVRNRQKRRIREVFRLREGRISTGYDIVIVARGALVEAPFSRLAQDFDRIFMKYGLMTKEKP